MEAYKLFEDLVFEINNKVTSYLLQGTLIFSDGQTLEQVKAQRRNNDLGKMRTNRTGETRERAAARAAAEGVSRRRRPETFKRTDKKIGRNDPCPCGSGKKYKHCHGRA